MTLSQKWNKGKWLFAMSIPCLLYYLIFKYVPIFGIVVAFKDYNLYKGIWASDWVGLKYFNLFFDSPDFWLLLRNTFLLGFYNLVFGFAAPIILALLLNEMRLQVFKRFVQTVSYLPHFISNVVAASMVIIFLSPSGGMFNRMLESIGLESVNFMIQPGWFRPIYVLSEIWQHVGWESIIFLAALTAIDPSLYEAAGIDGANRWKKTLHVTLPGISSTMIVLFILKIGSMMEIGFEKVFLLSNPATFAKADILSTYVYRTGLVNGNFSYGSAIDLFTAVVSFVFLLSANYMSRKFTGNSLW
ncbi:ABC transporter permease [Cohnella soli]|uniref:ABC transporter permease n=1 Tax=Cohnella soli TaxID=425005 RepID=A0ABW0HUX5_9BACL